MASAGKSRVIDTDKGFRAFFKNLNIRGGRKIGIKVGITSDDDTREDGDSNLEIATHHEFGAPKANIPERSFIRWTADTHRKKYQRLIKKAEEAALKNPRGGNTAVKSALFQLGETAVADIQNRIDSNIPPPLAEVTVLRKGDDLALVDTGEMRGAISWAFTGI
jgi:hypothetical protein